MEKLINIDELAEILRLKRATVRWYLSRNPSRLPPAVKMPGAKGALWRRQDVEKWVERYVETPPR